MSGLILCFDNGLDECWLCGGHATLGGTQDAIGGIDGRGRFCSEECAEEYLIAFPARTELGGEAP